MIAADTSSLIAFFAGESGADVEAVNSALSDGQICLPPIVLAELLSDPKNLTALEPVITAWPLLDTTEGYWTRAGRMRAALIQRGLKPKMPDALIAQSCIDHDVPLITRNGDFRHFAKYCGLKRA